MKECRHLFVNELNYPHPKKFGKLIVMKKCSKCGKIVIIEKSILLSFTISKDKTSEKREKTLTKKAV